MYLALKTLHILSATVLFGTGLGTAFFMLMANRSGNRHAMAVVTGHVMKADLYFTTPSIVIQAVSGVGLTTMAGYSVQFSPMNWLGLSVVLYCIAGACWLPVLWLQWRMHQLASCAPAVPALAEIYWKFERAWVLLGIPAFVSLAIVFWLMTGKPF
ncbi:MAG: DUF2269 domain-containing protein [Betaproteobacteria bacterium]